MKGVAAIAVTALAAVSLYGCGGGTATTAVLLLPTTTAASTPNAQPDRTTGGPTTTAASTPDAQPDRTIGIQILNPRNLTITVRPGYDTSFPPQPIPGLRWVVDTPTFPGNRLVNPTSFNWHDTATAVNLMGVEAAHGVMEFRCDEMPTFSTQIDDPLHRIDVRFKYDFTCDRNPVAQHCDSEPRFFSENEELCEQCIHNCPATKAHMHDGGVMIRLDCSKNTTSVSAHTDDALLPIDSQCMDDWLTFEVPDFVGLDTCPDECQAQCVFNSEVLV